MSSCFLAQYALSQTASVIPSSIVDQYVQKFNDDDEEHYQQHIPNESAASFLKKNVPLFECPDKKMEETYYFRWWTFRKHIKKTPEGFIITEFLPDVRWAGKYNGICCPAGLQFREGRWFHDKQYLNDYAYYWLRGGGDPRAYSFPIADALYNYYLVSGNDTMIKDLYSELVVNFEEWEKMRFDEKKGLFWQYDDRDGMEHSIGGNGYRATINSYMAADALSLFKIGSILNDKKSAYFAQRAASINEAMFTKLWDEASCFLKVLPLKSDTLSSVRELHGYTPWCYNLADQKYAVAWKYLMTGDHFYTSYGPTTAEQNHPGFSISYEGHECQWNGPSWPFSTSITLVGLANVLNEQQQPFISGSDYFKLLKSYAKSHSLQKDDGTIVPWIDENLDPLTGKWLSREILKAKEIVPKENPRERGKDYNHSSFCDLIISGLVGIRPQENGRIVVNPLLPENEWDYFCLDNVSYQGSVIAVVYDKTGLKYGLGKGLMLYADGKKVASSPRLSALEYQL